MHNLLEATMAMRAMSQMPLTLKLFTLYIFIKAKDTLSASFLIDNLKKVTRKSKLVIIDGQFLACAASD